MADTGKITKRIITWAIAGAAVWMSLKGVNKYLDQGAYDKLPHEQKVAVDSLRNVGKPEEVVQKNIDAYNGIVKCIKKFEEDQEYVKKHINLEKYALAYNQSYQIMERFQWMNEYLDEAQQLLKEITAMNTTQHANDLAEEKPSLSWM